MTEFVSDQLRNAIKAGFAEDDWSSLGRLMARSATLPPLKK